MAEGTRTYGVGDANIHDGQHKFWIPVEGFSAVCTKLQKIVDEHCQKQGFQTFSNASSDSVGGVLLNSRVTDVIFCRNTTKYHVCTICRKDGKSNTFFQRDFISSAVICAVPPHCAMEWPSVKTHLMPVLSSVEPIPLMKVLHR